MTKLDKYLQEIKARCDVATDGPWKWDSEGDLVNKRLSDGRSKIILSPLGDVFPREEDEAFIAHARTDVEVLLKMVKQLYNDREFYAQKLADISFSPIAVYRIEKLIPQTEGGEE